MIDLPECPPLAAAAAARLAPRLPLRFAWASGVVVASLCAGPAPPAEWPRFGLRLAGHRAELCLQPALLPQAALAAWPGAAAAHHPPDLAAILRDVLLAEIGGAITQASGATPEWEAPGPAPPHTLRLLAEADGALLATIAFDAEGLDWLAGRCAGLPRRQAQPDWLALPLRLLVGRPMMAAAELRGLAPGDVVLLDPAPFDADGNLIVLLDAGAGPWLRAALLDGRLHLMAELDGHMDEPHPLPAQRLDDLPVRLDCELARLDMPLGRLRELAVGQVLDLGVDAANAVSLRVNGQLVAMAEMVRIADRVGLRITETRLEHG